MMQNHKYIPVGALVQLYHKSNPDNITVLAQDKPNIEITLAQSMVAYNIVPRLFGHWH